MRTHTQIVEEAGADALLAETLGVKVHQPRDWRLRNSIPSEFWRGFAQKGLATLEELAAAAETKRRPATDERMAG